MDPRKLAARLSGGQALVSPLPRGGTLCSPERGESAQGGLWPLDLLSGHQQRCWSLRGNPQNRLHSGVALLRHETLLGNLLNRRIVGHKALRNRRMWLPLLVLNGLRLRRGKLKRLHLSRGNRLRRKARWRHLQGLEHLSLVRFGSHRRWSHRVGGRSHWRFHRRS